MPEGSESTAARLRPHNVTLSGETRAHAELRLRPMTEDDWDLLEQWNADPEVLFFAEGDDVAGWSPAQVRAIYRTVSQHAYCFIIEYLGNPVGEGWLEEMNLNRVLQIYPGQDVRRIDLMIGDKSCWGKGIGTEVIRLLTAFGFQSEGADLIYIPEVADYNPRSLKAFQRVGYSVVATFDKEPGRKARRTYDLAMSKSDWKPIGSVPEISSTSRAQ